MFTTQCSCHICTNAGHPCSNVVQTISKAKLVACEECSLGDHPRIQEALRVRADALAAEAKKRQLAEENPYFLK